MNEIIKMLIKIWHDPVWSKVIAFIITSIFTSIFGVIVIIFYKIYKNQYFIIIMIIAILIICVFSFFIFRKLSLKSQQRKLNIKQYENVVEIINKALCKELIVRTIPSSVPPSLLDSGPLNIDEESHQLSLRIKHELYVNKQPDDPCAAVINTPAWSDNPLTFLYKHLLYSDTRVLRKLNKNIKYINANGVLFSEEERCVIVHRRSDKSYDYPNTLHTFGGGFMPPNINGRGDDGGIRECLEREIHEETGVNIQIPDTTQIVIIDEFNINFIQIVYLGINITKEQVKRFRPNWEGSINKIAFDNLFEKMKEINDWTISGWCHILLWLALDTPNAKKPLYFNGIKASDLSDNLSKYLIKNPRLSRFDD